MEHSLTFPVEAPPDDVWAVLSDVERWPEWTASMRTVERLDQGELQVGSSARIKQPALPRIVWTVTEVVPGRSFTWEAHSGGVHTTAFHTIEPDGDGSCVTLGIDQRGPMSWLVTLLYGRRTKRSVAMEAEGLRSQAVAATH